MNVALIGYGYWGINLARTISSTEGLNLVSIFDNEINRINEAKKLYEFTTVTSFEELFNLDIEAVFIATPPASHYNIAKQALLNNKHIFVEKPFTLNLDEAYELIDTAESKNLKYMVDHVFIYSEPVKYLKNNLDELGEVVYINSRRINLGLFQYTTDVIWDLAVHDLSIIEYLVGLDIEKVSVFKKKYKNFPNEAIASINLELKSGIVLNINVSWLSPVKVRELIIGGTKKSIVYDDTKKDAITIYDAGVILEQDLDKDELYNQMVQYKYGEISSPSLPKNMSLNNAVEHFYECIKDDKEPHTSKKSIINVIKALEIISKVG
ncbi:Gfo/Idh/MocA family oxidoreductase [Halarcobacter sp.]|uniref:Gfo/Idh/MocA family protein n=1 Tax=Halarcobacter sp. TaxID=2321133 RepID=UPI002AAA7E39|nr:Gfo/Idh/MocA family oxidoreductase [Halarcobacter sp.]